MINVQCKATTLSLVFIAMLGLSACSTLDTIQNSLSETPSVNYQNNKSIKNLEVPPDLTAPEFDSAFVLPKEVVSAVSLEKNALAVSSQPKAKTQTEFPAGFVLDSSKTGDLARVNVIDGRSVLQVNDTYARSLILTEVMLVRLGFSTVSKSVAGDVITAMYNGNYVTTDGKQAGFLNKKLDLPDNNIVLATGKSYDISIKNEQVLPTVKFARTDRKRIPNSKHAKIVGLLGKTFNGK